MSNGRYTWPPLGLDYPWVLVSGLGPRANFWWTLRDECTSNKERKELLTIERMCILET